MELPLPSVSPVLAEILATASRTDVTAKELEQALSPTPELAHALVRLAHSFGRKGRAASVGEALSELGGRGVHGLLACLGAKKVLSVGQLRWKGLDEFWLTSLRRAAAAHTMARVLKLNDDLDLFALGFLLDVGIVVRVHEDPSFTLTCAELAGELAPKRFRAERKLGGPGHDEIGLSLCRRWQLPARIAVPLRYHHEPQNAPVAYQSTAFIAKAAEALADLFTAQDKKAALMLAESALGSVGIETTRVGMIVDRMADLVDDTAYAFGLDPKPEPRFEDLDETLCARTSQVRDAGSDEEVRRENARLVRENKALRERLLRLETRLARGSILPPRGEHDERYTSSASLMEEVIRPRQGTKLPTARLDETHERETAKPKLPDTQPSLRPVIRKRTVS